METRVSNNDVADSSGKYIGDNTTQEATRYIVYERTSSRDNNGGRNGIELQNGCFSDSANVDVSSWRRKSLSFSNRVAPQAFDDDIESEVASQAGDIGDRQLSSRRNSGSGKLRSSVDRLSYVKAGAMPITEESYFQAFGFPSHDINALSTTSPLSLLPSEIVSPISTDAILHSKDKTQSGLSHPNPECIICGRFSGWLYCRIFGGVGIFYLPMGLMYDTVDLFWTTEEQNRVVKFQ